MDSTVKHWLLAGVLGLPLLAAAQQLLDPTRPPALLANAAANGGATLADGEAQTGPRLQTILIGQAPQNRRLAVIDGITVKQGGKFGDAVVELIADNSVVLRRGKLKETLTLFPAAPAGGRK
jgi:MSHA biogenesis protein MshK